MPYMPNRLALFIQQAAKQLFFDSDLPQDMQNLIEKWRNYTSSRNPEEI